MKSPLICTHIAEGHSRAVLALYATDDMLFSASKDKTVKVWDLHQGNEMATLGGHPNSVTSVQYDEKSWMAYTVSSAYIKVWDMRYNKCVKTLRLVLLKAFYCQNIFFLDSRSSYTQFSGIYDAMQEMLYHNIGNLFHALPRKLNPTF